MLNGRGWRFNKSLKKTRPDFLRARVVLRQQSSLYRHKRCVQRAAIAMIAAVGLGEICANLAELAPRLRLMSKYPVRGIDVLNKAVS